MRRRLLISIAQSNGSDDFFATIFAAVKPSIANLVLQNFYISLLRKAVITLFVKVEGACLSDLI